MRSVGTTFSDYEVDGLDLHKIHSAKDYEKLANDVVRAKEAKDAANAGKAKLTDADKGAAKAIGGLET